MNAIQVLVNESHGKYQAHVLAMSGNLFVPVDDELIRLSQWIKSRTDMPDEIEEVFHPQTTQEWGENWEYLINKENMVCMFDGIKYDSIHEDECGRIVGIHPDATQNAKGEWVL
ncbi:hypothetical protein OTK49_28425 [Vibrio coralliirubri]|uniref:hypothetical protein n=1 Tax=Vibrio coralliirubri TaxID=1516159 RepID=UPI002284779F|nr:hypothetical protein [Vibrio coralliirubri]MCY9866470.1 hypothetical protein [Vibrio coralliirubri]